MCNFFARDGSDKGHITKKKQPRSRFFWYVLCVSVKVYCLAGFSLFFLYYAFSSSTSSFTRSSFFLLFFFSTFSLHLHFHSLSLTLTHSFTHTHSLFLSLHLHFFFSLSSPSPALSGQILIEEAADTALGSLFELGLHDHV